MTEEVQTEQTETATLLDDIMNGSLGDVEAAPDFVTPPSGKYKLEIVSANAKQCIVKKDKPEERADIRATITMRILETIELASPSEVAPANKDMFSISFLLGGEGASYFKAFLINFVPAEKLAEFSKAEAMQVLPELQFTATLTSTEKDGFTNTRIRNVVVD